jgi:hypothetical protein
MSNKAIASTPFFAFAIGELDAIVCKYGVDAVRHSSDKMAQELGGLRSGDSLIVSSRLARNFSLNFLGVSVEPSPLGGNGL